MEGHRGKKSASELGARFLQGAGAGAVRVAMNAAVRDHFAGQAMVDVSSRIAAIFLLVPIVGPTVGQLLLAVGSWKLIFFFIALVGSIFGVWSALRLGESLRPADRRSFAVGAVGEGFRLVLRQRHACFHGIVGAFMYGIISNLLNTAQPIYVDIFGLGPWFPVAFAFSTIVAALANLVMPWVTRRFGLRRTAHASVPLIIVASATSALQSLAGPPSVWSFFAMLLLLFPAVIATFSTTGALAMEPLGEVAGTAAAVFGAVTMMGGALFGAITAQLYDGTVTPVLWSTCLLGVCAMGSLALAEGGRLFGRDRGPEGVTTIRAFEVSA